jgi:hypothetical protein
VAARVLAGRAARRVFVRTAVAPGYVLVGPSVTARSMRVRATFSARVAVTAAGAAFAPVLELVAAEGDAAIELLGARVFVASVTDVVTLLTATGAGVCFMAVRAERAAVGPLFTALGGNARIDARLENRQARGRFTLVSGAVTLARGSAASVSLMTEATDRLTFRGTGAMGLTAGTGRRRLGRGNQVLVSVAGRKEARAQRTHPEQPNEANGLGLHTEFSRANSARRTRAHRPMKDRSPPSERRKLVSHGRAPFAQRRSFCSALIAGALVSLVSACVENGVEGPTLSGAEPLELRADNSGMALSVALDGDTVVRGENVFLVRLSDTEAALTSANAVMPGHGHDTASPSIELTDNEYRVSGLLLFMPGRWEVTLELEVGGTSDQAVFSVDVP